MAGTKNKLEVERLEQKKSEMQLDLMKYAVAGLYREVDKVSEQLQLLDKKIEELNEPTLHI